MVKAVVYMIKRINGYNKEDNQKCKYLLKVVIEFVSYS